MKRAIVSAVLCSTILAGTSGATAWPGWAQDARDWAQSLALSEDILDAPEAAVTRGQAVQLLYEVAGRPNAPADTPFTDVPETYADATAWAAEQGFVEGLGDGKYQPERPLTRQEFAAMLYRSAGGPAVSGSELSAYTDAASVADWAWDAVLWCSKIGLLNGRSNHLLAPEDTIILAEAVLILQRDAQLPDTAQLQKDLETLSMQHHPIGSVGEQAAVQYLQSRFTEMGYLVSTQDYTNDAGQTGANVIAVKPAAAANADILLVSAHHDSVPTAYGANDNASGVTALLAVAEAMKDTATDTEIRFISFTDEENGKNGSRYYTSKLSEAERSRMIGDIQLDMLGGLGSSGSKVCTMDGETNWLSDLIGQKNASFMMGAETASDHASFQLAGVPSVLVMQNGRGYLYHSAADVASQIDLYTLAGAAQTVTAAVQEIADADTPSYRDIAHAQAEGYTYRQTRQNVIYFNSSLSDTEAYIGVVGELVDTEEVNGDGWTDVYDTYLYSMRWFDGEQPMNTYYRYRNGFLQNIEIHPTETGYTSDQVRSLITAMYGAPSASVQGSESWADEVYSKYITLSDTAEGCMVTVSNYSLGITNVIAEYPVVNGRAQIGNAQHAKVWDFLCAILPDEARVKIAEFNLYTDGYSNVLSYTSPVEDENGGTDNTRFSISIDYYDVYDENGNSRDWSKLTYTILHEYGHVLLEDETQVDLLVGSDTHDPAGFVPGSFRKTFYDRFWKQIDTGAGVNDYEQNPTHYVSRYGANYFHEDIADTFAVFVLGAKPEGDTVAEQKLLAFWADADMVTLRQAIRDNMSLDQPQKPVEPEEPTESENPDSGEEVLCVTDTAQIKAELNDAIATVRQPAAFVIAALEDTSDLKMDVQNLYNSLLSEHPAYKYAYDMQVSVSNGVLRCTFSYMPYRSGDYPTGFQGVEAACLNDLIRIAWDNKTKESVSIRITDPELTVDDMNKALQQAGGSYILCQLNEDGTAITFAPQNNLGRTEALEHLSEIDRLTSKVVDEIITADMTGAEKAEALYTYVTENVRYDQRYYADRDNMPYDSQTAYGALHDGLAICGGYAQAVQRLFEAADIPCYTVTGTMGGENHMWNIAYLDGVWRYYDATSDRGRAAYWFNYFGVPSEQLARYEWDTDWVQRLTRSAV